MQISARALLVHVCVDMQWYTDGDRTLNTTACMARALDASRTQTGVYTSGPWVAQSTLAVSEKRRNESPFVVQMRSLRQWGVGRRAQGPASHPAARGMDGRRWCLVQDPRQGSRRCCGGCFAGVAVPCSAPPHDNVVAGPVAVAASWRFRPRSNCTRRSAASCAVAAARRAVLSASSAAVRSSSIARLSTAMAIPMASRTDFRSLAPPGLAPSAAFRQRSVGWPGGGPPPRARMRGEHLLTAASPHCTALA